MNKYRIFLSSIIVAIALGLLEAAWTRKEIGGPQNTWLGIFAILIAFLCISWPYIWRIPVLAILEETVHIYTIGIGITEKTLFQHWSINYLGGVNVYPYILFPMITIISELCYHVLKRRKKQQGK